MDHKTYLTEEKDCASCMDSIDQTTYVLYKDNASSNWKLCGYCSTCVQTLLDTKWDDFVRSYETIDCLATLKRLTKNGPPINLREPKGIPCENDNDEVFSFYYCDKEQSAKLKNSYEGAEREKMWSVIKKKYEDESRK